MQHAAGVLLSRREQTIPAFSRLRAISNNFLKSYPDDKLQLKLLVCLSSFV